MILEGGGLITRGDPLSTSPQKCPFVSRVKLFGWEKENLVGGKKVEDALNQVLWRNKKKFSWGKRGNVGTRKRFAEKRRKALKGGHDVVFIRVEIKSQARSLEDGGAAAFLVEKNLLSVPTRGLIQGAFPGNEEQRPTRPFLQGEGFEITYSKARKVWT